MLTLLLVALCLPQDLRIEGLRPGERFEVLPAVELPAPEQERFEEGRVVDARTGFPVPGAQLEAWTEEITEASGGFRRIGEATTGPDGLFRLGVQQGALRGDKVRVRAAGYLTLSTTVGDELLRLMPAPQEPTLLRVVDLHDRPIPGARITSTYSCAHDLPAFEVRTDAFGIARLPQWGLQDQTSELRVRADGYGAIKYLYEIEVLADRQMLASGELPVARLPRQRPLRARVLGRDGQPLVATPLLVDNGEGDDLRITGEDGGFEVLSPYYCGELTLYALCDGRKEFVYVGRLPSTGAPALRLHSDSPSDDLPLVGVVAQVEQDEEGLEGLELVLIHEDGWSDGLRWEDGAPRGELPPGKAVLLVGRPFRGWEEQLVELELVEGETTTVGLDPRREPRLTVLTPPEESYRLIVQAGDDSCERRPERSGETTLSVPAGRPVTVLSKGERTRRLSLPPLEGDTTADLRPDACLLPRSVAQRRDVLDRTALRVRGVGGDGEDLPAGELAVAGVGDPTVTLEEAGTWWVEAVGGTPVLLQHRAEGLADLDTVTYAPLPGEEAPEVVLSPTPLATLSIESGLDFEVLGPLAEDLEWTGLVHPGPLTLTLRLADGRRVALALELAPGERRVLTLRRP